MSALALKIIAGTTMLADHIGFAYHIPLLRIIGRLSFPIFLHLIYNGYKHTKSPLRYALRLGFFAIVSQVPFSLFCYGIPWHNSGNVFFTLLAALLCIWAADVMLKNKYLRWFFFLPALAVFSLYHFGIIHSDYGPKAILMAMVFFLFDGKKLWKMAATAVLFLIAVYYHPIVNYLLDLLRDPGSAQFLLTSWEKTQIYSALALVPIFCYNGKKGSTPKNPASAKTLQWGFYLFYPVHLLILWAISL